MSEFYKDDFPLHKCTHCGSWFVRTIVSTGWPSYLLNYSHAINALMEIAWKGGNFCIKCCNDIAHELLVYLWRRETG